MKIEVYKDAAGEWRWRSVSRNGRTLADSAEGYTRKASAERAATSYRDAMAKPVKVVLLDNEGNEVAPVRKAAAKKAPAKRGTVHSAVPVGGGTIVGAKARAAAKKAPAKKAPAKKAPAKKRAAKK